MKFAALLKLCSGSRGCWGQIGQNWGVEVGKKYFGVELNYCDFDDRRHDIKI
jgi:hypothetical protein